MPYQPGAGGTFNPALLPEGVKVIKQCDFVIQFVLQPIPQAERDAKAKADAEKAAAPAAGAPGAAAPGTPATGTAPAATPAAGAGTTTTTP
jgi:hypothetical protein